MGLVISLAELRRRIRTPGNDDLVRDDLADRIERGEVLLARQAHSLDRLQKRSGEHSVILEQHSMSLSKLEDRAERLDERQQRLEISVEQLDARVEKLDTKVERLDAGVQRLESGQQLMLQMLTSLIERD
jgi:archaellum component FlaC